MGLKLYCWDELSGEITQGQSDAERVALNREGGWEYQGLTIHNVAVLRTDRHFALECWAADESEANWKFSKFPPYAEFYL
jgi:hypothetical protein